MTHVRGKDVKMIEKKHRYNKDFKKPVTKEVAEPEAKEEKVVAPKKPKKIQKRTKTTSRLNVRRTPEVADNIVTTLGNGVIVTVIKEENGWTEIDKGFVMSKYLEDIK